MQLAMAISRREVFFPIIYILVWSRPCLHETTCSLHVTINQTSLNDCSDVFRSTCNQLQAALARVTLNASDLTDGPVCVTLMPGNHFLDYSDTEIEYSVHIVGSRDGDTVLQCSQNESFNNATYEEFPLKFGADTRVLLDRVKFTDCARPLLFNGTASVTVQYCHFRGFTQAALEIYNTPSVTISQSTFTDNICKGQGTLRNSGNAGAVSIGYNETYSEHDTILIKVLHSQFTKNAAKLNSTSDCRGGNSVLSQKIFVQRGGGIACYFSAPALQSEVHISNCIFEGNMAEDSGGGVYMNLNGEGSTTNITITDTEFFDNIAMHGAGVEITFDTPNSVTNPNQLILQQCHFKGNSAYQGGAMKLPQLSQYGNLNYVNILECTFERNIADTGAALHIQTFIPGLLNETVDNTIRIHVNSSSFSWNTGRRGVAFFGFNHVKFTGINNFCKNIGPSLRVRGSLASLEGTLSFRDNRNHHEGFSGAVYVSSFSQLLLNPNVSISFTGNIGEEGAAMVVQTPRITSGFARTLYNPQCFLQFKESTKPPVKWAEENVTIYFSNNKAVVGPNLYISNLEACSWFNLSDEYFDLNISKTWRFINTKNDNYVVRNSLKNFSTDLYIQTQLSSLRLDDCPSIVPCWRSSFWGPDDVTCSNSSEPRHLDNFTCSNSSEPTHRDNVTCSNSSEAGLLHVRVYAGQNIPLKVRALDVFNHDTTGFVQVSEKGNGGIQFIPSILQITADDDNYSVSYTFNEAATYNESAINIQAAFSSNHDISTSFMLHPISCPPGFTLDSSNQRTCVCEVSREVLACDKNMKFILLNDGLWGAPPSLSRSLVIYPCPPQYCNCTGPPDDATIEGCALIYNEPDLSCTNKRTGVLCGECMDGFAVGMLSMECRHVTAHVNMYPWIIPMLVLFIAVSVVIIVKVGVIIPCWFLGFLFYIQVSPVAVASFNIPLGLKSAQMTYVNSLLSLYVPYDFSLHSSLSALEAYGLRYISPFLALVIATIAAVIKFNSRSWYGIWTLVLLMYGMMTETASSLLFCPTFTANTTDDNVESTTITVWFYDGSVVCYEGTHLFLTLLSILSLLLLALFIPLLTVVAYHKELSAKFVVLERRWLEKLYLCLTRPYHSHTRWWLPLELTRRFIFIISVIFCPGYVSLPLLEAGFLLALSWYIQPYRDWKANTTEAFSLCMLVVVLCLGNTIPLVDLGRKSDTMIILWPVFYLPLAVAVVTVVIYAGWKISKTKRLREAIVKETRRRRRYTELLSVRRKSVVKSSEVGFTNSVDVELSQM